MWAFPLWGTKIPFLHVNSQPTAWILNIYVYLHSSVCVCRANTWYWLVRRALLRSRLWLVSLRALSSPSSRVLSSWEVLSSPRSTEPWASSSACDANHSFWWACSLQHQHTHRLYSSLSMLPVTLDLEVINILLQHMMGLFKAEQ